MSMLVFTLIIILATLGTAFLSSIFGMLGGLILMGILVSIMPVSQAMVLHGLIQLTSNGYRAWLNRKDINWSIVTTLIVGNIIALAGLVFIAFVPDRITVLLGDRTYKLHSGITSESGRCVKSLGDPVAGLHPTQHFLEAPKLRKVISLMLKEQ